MSHPVRGAWIEMVISPNPKYNAESHPVRGAWIEMAHGLRVRVCRSCRTPSGVRGLKLIFCLIELVENSSHPVRGAWIEILGCCFCYRRWLVAPRQGCVD